MREKDITSPNGGGRKIAQRFFEWGAAVALVPLLSACGFHPLYGGMNGAMQATLSTIYVEPMPDRIGYELRNRMIDLLDGTGTPAGAAYRLKLSLTESSQGIALQNATAPGASTAVTRYNDTLKVTYTLTDRNGKVVTSGEETGLSTYNVLPSALPPSSSPVPPNPLYPNFSYGTLAAHEDADKRAAQDIAERIRLDLNVFFAKR
jgi:LPS-assembly lipoprotein